MAAAHAGSPAASSCTFQARLSAALAGTPTAPAPTATHNRSRQGRCSLVTAWLPATVARQGEPAGLAPQPPAADKAAAAAGGCCQLLVAAGLLLELLLMRLLWRAPPVGAV